MTMDPNLPATTDQAAAVPATIAAPEDRPASRRRQNITTGLFPIALGLLIVVFVALALWTLMTTTGGGGL